MQNFQLKQKGFTLIELLVATGITLVIIGAVSNLFFASLKGSAKTTVVNEAKQNGDYALSVMERMIRNAIDVTSSCSGGALDSLTITNPDGGVTIFACPSGSGVSLASNSAALTSDNVRVLESNCEFNCLRSGEMSSKVVKIKFSIQQPTASPGVSPRPEDEININFETSILVRNTGY